MKRINILIALSCLLILLFFSHNVQAQGISKMININYVQQKVVDSGDEGEGSWGWAMNTTYFDGYEERGLFSSKAVWLGCKSFTDTLGNTHSPKLSGHGQWETDDEHIFMPVKDAEGWTIHRYLRNQPPAVVVDGMHLEDPFPFNLSDEVAPDKKIPGTADIMIESWFNSDMGITVHQRVLAFSQKNHEKYHIYEWTFKNTGNVDTDATIEFPDQTLEDVYFLRQIRPNEGPKGWMSSYGEMPEDTLRIMYRYPMRQQGADWDNYGEPNDVTGFIQNPFYTAEAIHFASAAVNNMTGDDMNQPAMTGYYDCDLEMVCKHSLNLTSTQINDLYSVMKDGFLNYGQGWPEIEGSRPGHHSVRFDDRDFMYANDAPWWGFTLSGIYAYGPYTLAPGDSFKVIWSELLGTISAEKAYEVGTAWQAGTATWDGEDNLPPPYQRYPELYDNENDWAKDCWVSTGKDSLFKNAAAAQWAVENNFNVPAAPPAPSIEVTSMSNQIKISWDGTASESVADFAGYRVYRARDSWYPHIPEEGTELIGVWELIYECGGNSGNAITYEYDDKDAQRGKNYYYYVTAFDDGVQNSPDFHGKTESLESSKFLNMTTQFATLTRPAGTDIDKVRIVPNPFHIDAGEKQFGMEAALNKIMFFDLPLTCKIRIFTESGDLIKTLDHSGSGDEPFGKLEFQMQTTDDGQVIVSGIYIAHIETPDGKNTIKKFVVVR